MRQERSRRAHSRRGFTMIELMITVAVVAILASVALPGYREHVRTSRRAEAQAFLMAVAARQQQFLVDTRGYAAGLGVVALPVPANVETAYSVTMTSAAGPPPTFQVTATPRPESDQTKERCGEMSVDHTGAKRAALLQKCW